MLLRRPLREVVSWNTQKTVDVNHFGSRPLREVVSWNAMKTVCSIWSNCRPLREVVSWNINNTATNPIETVSTSSWGRELKFPWSWSQWFRLRRPLREVVSWNANWNMRLTPAVMSTSSWGRELKCYTVTAEHRFHSSTSSWGRELKYPLLFLKGNFCGRPLREVVSWNIADSRNSTTMLDVDLVTRSWVEMKIGLSSN